METLVEMCLAGVSVRHVEDIAEASVCSPTIHIHCLIPTTSAGAAFIIC